MTTDRVKVAFDQVEGIAVITLCGEVDLGDLAAIVDAFALALHDPATAATLVDLSALTFGDSTLLNQLLVSCAGHATKARPLVLCGPVHPVVQRLLQVTGVDSVLPLAANRQEALRRLRAGKPS